MKYKYLLLLLSIVSAQYLSAQNKLLIPDTISGQNINLNLQKGSVQFYPGTKTQTFGVNGNILGPTLLLKKHQNVTINVKNELDDTTTIHWHGMHVAPHNDGGPHITINPGSTWSPGFEVLDHASTHWYHPHLHMHTNEHVQKGIAGFIIVRDTAEAALALPRTYGVDDFPLAIQTKVFDSNNQIVTGQNALDTALMVNATLNPYLDAPSQVVRFRILNGSSERVYNLGFSDNISFSHIGSDGGLLKSSVSLSRLLLAPGERAEILVNLSAFNEKTVYLKNYGSAIPNAHYGAAQPGMGPGQTIPGYTSNRLNGADFNILTINVGAQTSNPITSIPGSLVSHSPWQSSSANITRTLTFTSMNMGPTAIQGPFLINGAHFDMNVINYSIPFNNLEIWELRNQTPIAHPFHIHNVQFYILDINGVAPSASLQGRKDVVLVPGGNGVVRFITKFEDFYDDSMPYMYHCHMLTHEDDGMMGQFVVKSPCTIIQKNPENINTTSGSSALFSVGVTDTVGTSYQWQSNIGFGFQDLQNAGQYSGVNTSKLTVSNVTSTNNNQLFRCKVVGKSCEMISNIAALYVDMASVHSPHPFSFSIYPNPAHGFIALQIKNINTNTDVMITDISGRMMQSLPIHQENTLLDVNAWSAGIYYITVTQNGLKKSIPFVKQ